MKQEYLKATFKCEGKSRFTCTVFLDEKEVECYVSSSSKLSKYLSFSNNEVLISKNGSDKLRTKFTLEAVKVEDTYYYVNFNRVNRLYEEHLYNKGFAAEDIYREHNIKNIIKTDFLINEHACVEVKSLLSIQNKILFPDKSSLRIKKQLLGYIELLELDFEVTFAFVAMAEGICHFEFNDNNVELYFSKAISCGMQIEAYSLIYDGGEFKIANNSILKNNIIKAAKIYI